jgi:SAM-dependent methyltransferase
VPAGGRILDAGCGFGEWVVFLNSRGYRAEGLDYSTELVKRLDDTYPGFAWKVGDIRAMDYADATFDAVISWGVIEHDEAGPGETLREFTRVLKPGGVVIVTVPLDSEIQRRSADYLYHRGAEPQVFFQYFMTEEELAAQVRGVGLHVEEQGVLPNAIIQLVSPQLSARLRGVAFRVVNLLTSTFMSWIPRYCVMRYCVASKPPHAPERLPGEGIVRE